MHKLLFALGSTLLLACIDPARRPLGATCGDDDECVSGLCLANQCVSPAGDEDDDGLTNAVEAALGTDAFTRDTDLDGEDDATERGAGAVALDADGDGIPDALESATGDGDGDCVPDELDPVEAGVLAGGCGQDTREPDAQSPSDASDAEDDTQLTDVGPLDTSDPVDSVDAPDSVDVTAPADVADSAAPGDVDPGDVATPGDGAGDTSEPTASCGVPDPIMGGDLGLRFSSPFPQGGGGSQLVVTFQSGDREHYALRLGHFGWGAPELMVSGVDTNPTNQPDLLSVTDKLVAFRADRVDGAGGVLALWSWRSEAWSVTSPWPGLGTYGGGHAVLDDETVLASAFVGDARGLELLRWTRAAGFGTATKLAPYENEPVFETQVVVDGAGDGVVLALLADGRRLDAHPLAAGSPAGAAAGVGPTGAQSIFSDFKAARLPDGGVLAVWSEGSLRLVAAEHRVVDGVGTWSAPRVIVPGDAGRPILTVDSAGRAVVLYSNEAGDHWLRRGLDGAWSEGQPLGARTSYQRLVVEDRTGFLWTSWVDDDGVVEVLRLGPASAGWTVVARFERGADELSRGPAHMGLTPDGDALVFWGANLGASDRVSATTCR